MNIRLPTWQPESSNPCLFSDIWGASTTKMDMVTHHQRTSNSIVRIHCQEFYCVKMKSLPLTRIIMKCSSAFFILTLTAINLVGKIKLIKVKYPLIHLI